MTYQFKTDRYSLPYCEEIISCMIDTFSITRDEAIRRMNATWFGLELIGEDDLIYHEEPEYWAKDICYGNESLWWLDEINAVIIPIEQIKNRSK